MTRLFPNLMRLIIAIDVVFHFTMDVITYPYQNKMKTC